jgi:uncharacterized protein YeaO (DUF488 family)
MLLTKSIYLSREKSDGLRISVMLRHTLEDGVTPDPKIQKNSYDLWLKILGPPAKLVGDYYKRGISWEEYEKQYKKYLKRKYPKVIIQYLASASLTQNLTLLGVEENPEKCHRRLLAEECKKYNPELEVRIN